MQVQALHVESFQASLPLNCDKVHPWTKPLSTLTLTALDGSHLQLTVSSRPLKTFWFLSLKFQDDLVPFIPGMT